MFYSIIANALVVKDNKILISQRGINENHDPCKWTIPGGKVEEIRGDVWNVLEKTLKKEVKEEVDVEIGDDIRLVTNNTFIRTGGQCVVAMIFICYWAEGIAKPSEDTHDVAWITESDLYSYDFSPNVAEYLRQGFKYLKA